MIHCANLNGYSPGNPAQTLFVDTALQHALTYVRQVWNLYSQQSNFLNSFNMCTSNCLDEFFFCLLGGYSITYEANVAAYLHLKQNDCLTAQWFDQTIDHCEYLVSHLQSVPKDPLDKTSGMFCYRFPNAKARVLVQAAIWLRTTLEWDLSALIQISPLKAREILLSCPGMGYKTASWFLRNIGHGSELAIVDVHVERLAKQWAIIPHGLTLPRDYLEIEQRLLHLCKMVPAPLDLLDLVLWQYARSGGDVYGTEQPYVF